MEKGSPGSPTMPREAIVRDMVEGTVLAMFNNEGDAQQYADLKNNADRAPATWVIISSLIRSLECMDEGLQEDDATVKAALAWLEANDPYPKTRAAPVMAMDTPQPVEAERPTQGQVYGRSGGLSC